jgi:hypothetical protein
MSKQILSVSPNPKTNCGDSLGSLEAQVDRPKRQHLDHKCACGDRSIENTMVYVQLVNFGSNEWQVAHSENLAEEDKLVQTSFEFVRYDEREQVAISENENNKKPRFDRNSSGFEVVSWPSWPFGSNYIRSFFEIYSHVCTNLQVV